VPRALEALPLPRAVGFPRADARATFPPRDRRRRELERRRAERRVRRVPRRAGPRPGRDRLRRQRLRRRLRGRGRAALPPASR
jgi:hypothetical protein